MENHFEAHLLMNKRNLKNIETIADMKEKTRSDIRQITNIHNSLLFDICFGLEKNKYHDVLKRYNDEVLSILRKIKFEILKENKKE
jgi:hypothetical protein